MRFRNFLLAMVAVLPVLAKSQDLIPVEGTWQIKMEDNMSKEEARQKAEEYAMIDAINKSFGSYVEQTADIMIENGKVSYDIIGSTFVRGEWIRTTSLKFTENIKPVEGTRGKENELWITCSVKGEARKITGKAKLEAITLSCPDINCPSIEFKNNQELYLYFKSPVPGFLSVFIEEGDTTRRLFPYDNQGDQSSVNVEGDKQYILFHDHLRIDEFRAGVDKIVLYTTRQVEYNNIHVVFSTEPYSKPFLTASVKNYDGYTIPRSIPTAEFREWLADCRVASTDFQSVKIRITIRKK